MLQVCSKEFNAASGTRSGKVRVISGVLPGGIGDSPVVLVCASEHATGPHPQNYAYYFPTERLPLWIRQEIAKKLVAYDRWAKATGYNSGRLS